MTKAVGRFTFKQAAKSGKTLKELILESVTRHPFNDGIRYKGYHIVVPFTSSTRKYVKIIQSDKDAVTLTIIDTQDKVDATEYFYRLQFGPSYKQFYDLHMQIFDFFDWFIKQVVEGNNKLTQIPGEQRDNLLLNFNLYKIFYDLFVEYPHDLSLLDEPDLANKLQLLKEIIVDPQPYLEFQTCMRL